MTWEKTGVRYLKTGDESGHLCERCSTPMIIIKKRGGKKRGWYLYCQGCGRKVPTEYVKYTSYAEVFV